MTTSVPQLICQLSFLPAWCQKWMSELLNDASGVGCNGTACEDCLPANTINGARPVNSVEWSEAAVFANALNEKTGLTPLYVSKDDARAGPLLLRIYAGYPG